VAAFAVAFVGLPVTIHKPPNPIQLLARPMLGCESARGFSMNNSYRYVARSQREMQHVISSIVNEQPSPQHRSGERRARPSLLRALRQSASPRAAHSVGFRLITLLANPRAAHGIFNGGITRPQP
jgi:hypothetical protein